MKYFSKFASLFILLMATAHIKAQQVDLELTYNCATSRYEVHMKVISQLPVFTQTNEVAFGSSGVGIVLPGNVTDISASGFNGLMTSVNGGVWSTASKINNYTFNGVPSDFIKVFTGGGNLPGAFGSPGTNIILFTFASPSGACIPGVRLFNNWTSCSPQAPAGSDPCSGQPGFGGSDHRNSIQLTTLAFTDIDVYRTNQNNTGTICGFTDFGDLPATWPQPKTTNASYCDANNNGVPDGTAGAVWAGALIDGEATQNFSATANGDNNNGVNDEDGFFFPNTPLAAGFSSTYNLILNSNEANKTVYYGVWFDWDNNSSFTNDVDGNLAPAFYSGSAEVTSPITVPISVKTPAGYSQLFKVRVIVSDVPVTSGLFDATIANGEIEDYQAPSQILPVTFGTITAEAKNCDVYLSFSYLNQQNNKAFEVEYSSNGTSWTRLAVLSNMGNNGVNNYSYMHTTPAAGGNYYRIKQVDLDGSFSYSKTVTTQSNCDGKVKIVSYPNPVINNLTIILPTTLGKVQLRITDAVGKIITSVTTGSSFNNINTQTLAAGMYMIEVISENKTIYSSRFVKQ